VFFVCFYYLLKTVRKYWFLYLYVTLNNLWKFAGEARVQWSHAGECRGERVNETLLTIISAWQLVNKHKKPATQPESSGTAGEMISSLVPGTEILVAGWWHSLPQVENNGHQVRHRSGLEDRLSTPVTGPQSNWKSLVCAQEKNLTLTLCLHNGTQRKNHPSGITTSSKTYLSN